MRVRPDLTNPSLPDMTDLDRITPVHSRHVDQGGLNPREGQDEAYQWPESGSSHSSKQKGYDEEEREGPILGPFGAKVAAAMTGAVTTSLLMTPFDVLKTRLQTVRPHPNHSTSSWSPPPPTSECCQTTILTPPKKNRWSMTSPSSFNPLTCLSASPENATPALALNTASSYNPPAATRMVSVPVEPPSGCLHPSKWVGIWGEQVALDQAMTRGAISRAGAGAATMSLPADAAVTHGFWSEVVAISRDSGVRGLWKGVGTTLAMGIPSSAIYMLGYEALLTRISPIFTGTSDPMANTSSLNRSPNASSAAPSLTPAPLIAGSLARTLSATIISPIEMFRTRLQALPLDAATPNTYASTAKDLSALVRSKGFVSLWRGLGPTLWRDVPFSGIYWAGFEILKSAITQDPFPPLSPISTSFISGAISGTIAALVTQPFDVLKTRRQVFTPSPDCSPAALTHRASTLPLALHVIKTEGWGALFAGTVPRCGKVAPACGLMIACYEGVGRYLGQTKG